MKRRLLLIEGKDENPQFILDHLRARLKSLSVTCVSSLDEAHRIIIDCGCDIIMTALKLPDADSPSSVVHTLMAYAPGVPIIVLTDLSYTEDDSSVMDIVAIGATHVLFRDDLRTDNMKLVSAIMDAVRILQTRDTSRDNLSERVQALAQKVWDVDGHMVAVRGDTQALSASLSKLVEIIDKRGGLEDRVVILEKNWDRFYTIGFRILVGAGSVLGTAAAAGIAAIINLYSKK